MLDNGALWIYPEIAREQKTGAVWQRRVSREGAFDQAGLPPLATRGLPSPATDLIKGAFVIQEAAMKGWIYFLAGAGLVKIGLTTRKPEQRVLDFSPKLPFETRLLHAFESSDVAASEALAHHVFKDDRVRGEWFRIDRHNRRAIREKFYDFLGELDE